MENTLSSKLLDTAADELAKLPGIGKKTALRLALHLLKRPKEEVEQLSRSLSEMREEIQRCKICKNISDTEICSICANAQRETGCICVTENIQDVIAIEKTGRFNGRYHVLGGLISPMDGIGAEELEIASLIRRLDSEQITEIILALSTTPEGDTTSFYIFRKLRDKNIRITTPAKGLSMGGELEYNDEITLGQSIQNRIDFQ
jgi:recombination protein RecR